jgi:hemerythrin-like domain-containing protein
VSPDGGRARAWGDELRRVHQRLREAIQLATDQVLDEDPSSPAGNLPHDLLVYCWGFCAALTGHHTSEDAALFPRLLADRPDLAPVIANLERDHAMIAHLIGELEQALRRGASQEEKLRHLAGIDAVMESHFGYEERQLVAVLNATASLGDDPTRVLGAIA